MVELLKFHTVQSKSDMGGVYIIMVLNTYIKYQMDIYRNQVSVATLLIILFNCFEIGSGAFYVIRNTKINSYEAFDKYFWYRSSGTSYDRYEWDEKIVKDSEVFSSEQLNQAASPFR
jgi:hypothetical protein